MCVRGPGPHSNASFGLCKQIGMLNILCDSLCVFILGKTESLPDIFLADAARRLMPRISHTISFNAVLNW